MKVFHRDKYKYCGVVTNSVDGSNYYSFQCIKEDFSPEFVLVKEAKMIYGDEGFVYFETRDLPELARIREGQVQSSSCVNTVSAFLAALSRNEGVWCNHRKDAPKGKVIVTKGSRRGAARRVERPEVV